MNEKIKKKKKNLYNRLIWYSYDQGFVATFTILFILDERTSCSHILIFVIEVNLCSPREIKILSIEKN